MAFNVLGLNHKTAPVALREKVAFNEDRLVAALRTLRQESGVADARDTAFAPICVSERTRFAAEKAA